MSNIKRRPREVFWKEMSLENLPVKVPRRLFPELESVFVPPDIPRGSELELVVTVKDENISVREFAMYLALIDRLYGRFSPQGLASYAHSKHGRLEIAEIHKSELEIILRVFHEYQGATAFILLLIFLRSLPQMFKTTSEGVKNLADAYKSYEEGRLVRENRRKLKETIEQEDSLKKLPEARKNQLVKLMEALFQEEANNLSAPVRFARRQVRNLVLRIRTPPSHRLYERPKRKFALGEPDDSSDSPK